METQKRKLQVGQFFAEDGTLISIPVRMDKKIAVLDIIASRLDPDLQYSERDLNEIISKYHHDTAAIRRHMIEFKILERNSESVYWVLNKAK